MCYPPEYYPPNVGPHSYWKCDCGQQWVAIGMIITNYPVALAGNDAEVKPERWIAAGKYSDQESFYDFRSADELIIKLLRRLIETAGGEWEDVK